MSSGQDGARNGTSERHCVLPVFGQTGLWRYYEKAVGAACLEVCFQLFRTVTNDTHQNLKVEHWSDCFTADSSPSIGREFVSLNDSC
jgi:hypothetical protein